MKKFPLHGASIAAIYAAALFASTGSAETFTTANEPENPRASKPTLNPKVIESVEVDLGDRSVFFQRVEPPAALPKQPVAPAPESKPLTSAERAAEEARANKGFEMLMLSATVYDREVTQLRWTHADREYRAFSNIDFHYLAGLGSFETADVTYALIMGLGDESREQAAADRSRVLAHGLPLATRPPVPPLADFSASRAEYFLAPGDSAVPPEALAAMDALHRHFDANRASLVATYQRRLVEQAEREKHAREHPPVPKDTVIQFWPKKSRNYPTGK